FLFALADSRVARAGGESAPSPALALLIAPVLSPARSIRSRSVRWGLGTHGACVDRHGSGGGSDGNSQPVGFCRLFFLTLPCPEAFRSIFRSSAPGGTRTPNPFLRTELLFH